MARNGIDSLSDDDLKWLESQLGRMFSEQHEYAKNFRTKNSCGSNVKGQTILRCLNAVRSTRNSKRIQAERW